MSGSEKDVVGRGILDERDYIGTVGEHGDEQVIQRYVRNQGRNPENYEKIHEGKQLELFPYQGKA